MLRAPPDMCAIAKLSSIRTESTHIYIEMDVCHVNDVCVCVWMKSILHMLIGPDGHITFTHDDNDMDALTTRTTVPSFRILRKNKMNFSFSIFCREKDTRGDSSYSHCKMYSNINWTSIQSKDYHLPNATANNQHPSTIGKYFMQTENPLYHSTPISTIPVLLARK